MNVDGTFPVYSSYLPERQLAIRLLDPPSISMFDAPSDGLILYDYVLLKIRKRFHLKFPHSFLFLHRPESLSRVMICVRGQKGSGGRGLL